MSRFFNTRPDHAASPAPNVIANPHPASPGAAPRPAGARLDYIPSLDGLRGLAVLAVMVFHFSPGLLPGGFLGVDMFFVLSGFLITGLLVKEWSVSGRIALGAFWGRRARRLLPAVLILLGVVAVYALSIDDRFAGRAIARDGLASLFYVANWHFIQAGEAYIQPTNQDLSPLRHMWSLAIEEQFYLVWPLVVASVGLFVAGISKAGGRLLGRAVAGVSIVFGLASFLAMILLYDPSAPDRVYYGTDSRAFLLLIGATVGALTAGSPLVSGARRRQLVVGAGSVAAVGLLALMALTNVADSWLYRGGYGLVGLAIILILAAAGQPGWNPLRIVLESRPIVWLGLISYGVYLWHWPAVIWLNGSNTGLEGPALFALRTAATLAVAVASYYLVELPIRQRRSALSLPRFWLRPMSAALVTAVPVMFLVPVLASPVSVDAGERGSPVEATMVTESYRQGPNCEGSLQRDAKLAGLRVLLVGNSIAEEISGCLETLLAGSGASLESITENDRKVCEFPDLVREQFAQPGGRPNVVIFFHMQLYEPCSPTDSERAQMERMLELWESHPVHTYLVPFVPPAEVDAVPVPHSYAYKYNADHVDAWANLQVDRKGLYESLAEQDPRRITVLDAGLFLRDDRGSYRWRMSCLADGSAGCDRYGQVVVRFPLDGLHFCSDPDWDGRRCEPEFRAGSYRVAAAIVRQLVESPPDP